jgi:hypothetical protein
VAALRAECGEDGDALFARYVNFFREDLIQAEKDFETAAGARNAKALYQAAHHLRGAALHFGARHLMELCLRVERAANAAGPFDEIAAHLPPVSEEIHRVREALETNYA